MMFHQKKERQKPKQRVPFSQRLFWSVFSIFLGFTACFLIFQYQREAEYTKGKLDSVLSNYNYQLHSRYKQTDDIHTLVRQFIDEIPQKDLRVTIIDLSGTVLFDNSGKETFDNHINRSEVILAIQHGEGYAIRSSGSTGKRYFYSASRIDDHIYRSAQPYNLYLKDILTINKDFLFFMVFMLVLFFIVLSRFSFSIGHSISKLRDFANNIANRDLQEITYTFPNDELGDISRNIVTLYQRQQEIKEDDIRRKRQLTQNVAHELKTPVSSIQGYLETILSNPDLSEEKKNYFLERCYAQSSRLTDLLRDISVLNRLDEASGMFDFSDVNLCKIVSEIDAECSPSMKEKNMTSTILISDDTTIQGNPSLLYSIFRNLYDNAIAYAGEGSHIEIACEWQDADFYYFRFADNGVGVDEQYLSRIFERFYRIDKGRSRKLGGTGLGLAIVKNGVFFHKGQITATSQPGKGVTFHFHLKKNR
ncbi:HAMP domain-containing sensor histidine kinase [Parabacteroides sp. PF5-6]|uniref:sensor histidine kinase n=1 Tax=Parabacteroides sp. PF5-6 TaxID=1742403 RepID=UPI0024075927|nr:HAMP domain-containing sensor histidine kinase [Parabacteroides sp. PF5-6]MDF9831236.1 signal transduction histidine kinase [Parabacteroides sp. PF5-6]